MGAKTGGRALRGVNKASLVMGVLVACLVLLGAVLTNRLMRRIMTRVFLLASLKPTDGMTTIIIRGRVNTGDATAVTSGCAIQQIRS